MELFVWLHDEIKRHTCVLYFIEVFIVFLFLVFRFCFCNHHCVLLPTRHH